MDWQLFALLALATYATTQTVTRYDGLGGIFGKLRSKTRGDLNELVSCPVCLGWYVSLVYVGLAMLVSATFDGLGLFLLVWMAVSGVSIILNIWSDV